MKIKELILPSPNPKESIAFYKEVLHLGSQGERVIAGTSEIGFSKDIKTAPYHMAFNIPINLLDHAQEWLCRRVELISFDGDFVVDFPNWRAKGMYFIDNHQNILEFIAREDIGIADAIDFNSDSILSVSEMSIVVDDLKPVHSDIQSIASVELYSGNLETFSALGDPEGLFITVVKDRKWFMSESRAVSVDAKIAFENRGKRYSLKTLKDGQVHVEEFRKGSIF